MEPDAAKGRDPTEPTAPAVGAESSPARQAALAAVAPVVSPHADGRYIPWLIVLLVILFQGAVRYRLADFPLERDEGEYAYAGQLILQGIPPYELAYNMKLPGTYVAYAAMMAVFGQTTSGVHLGLILVNAACIVLTFLVGRKLFDPTVGAVAAASFGILSLSYKFLGLSAHATHFVVLAMLAAVLCLLHAGESGRRGLYAGSGLLFGIAFLMKQQAVFFGIFGGAWIVWEELRGRPIKWERMGARALLFSIGCVAPFLWTCLALWQLGVFDMFWFWTFDYAREYVTSASLPDGLFLLKMQMLYIAHSFWLLMLMMALGLAMLWHRRPRPGRDTFLTVFLVSSFLTTCPGLYFRHHYFISMMPAMALLVGVMVSFQQAALARAGRPWWARQLPWVPVVAALILPLWRERDILFQVSPVRASELVSSENPFVESIEVARYVREHTKPSDRIAVLGSEPQIYFYAQRHSATGFIYTYSLLEEHRYALQMQAQMAKEIEAANPEFLIYVNVRFSWLARPRSSREIFEWMRVYFRQHYTLVGVVDMLAPDKRVYVWDDKAAEYKLKSERHILVFRRKPAP